MTAEKASGRGIEAYSRVGGYARAAKLSEEDMQAQMRRVRAARTEKDNARRAEAGLPPLAPKPKPLTDEEMVFWLAECDRRFPGRAYENRMQKPRLAVRLARENAARIVAEAFRELGGKA